MRKIFIFIIFMVLFLNPIAEAHRLHVVYKISEVEIQAYYGGNFPCRDAKVKIYDANGLYLEGTTDKDGKFRFPPKVGVNTYKVVVDAVHMPGHKAEVTINLTKSVCTQETPLYQNIIAGFGYLIGLAGIAMVYLGWKKGKND